MTDEPNRRPNQTVILALGLLAVGSFLLLRALGVLSLTGLELLFRFWPLVAIGFGLDLLGVKTGRNISFGILSLILLAALTLFGPALGLAGRTTTKTFRAPLENTRSADLQLDLGDAPTTLTALPERGELIHADITGRGRLTFSVRGGDHKTVRLGERHRFGFGAEGGRWDIMLNPNVPLELNIDGGSGQATLDLAGFDLTALDLEGGSGRTDLTLPASEEAYEATLDGGSGRTTLNVEDGATLELSVESGSGALETVFGENVAANLELDGGSGPMTFTLPDTAEARFEVEDSGSGAISVDSRLRQVSGDDDEGVWETPGFAEAERAVSIRLEDGGSGRVQVR